MATVSDAINTMTLNSAPYWWLSSGGKLVGKYVDSDDLVASTSHLTTVLGMQPEGIYQLKYTTTKDNHKGALSYTFSNSAKAVNTAQPQAAVSHSTNPYGLTDAQYQKLQSDIRKELLVEQMHAGWVEFIAEWPEYKKKIDKIEAYLKDDDNDGTPDIFEQTKKGAETVKTAVDTVNTLKNMKLFG